MIKILNYIERLALKVSRSIALLAGLVLLWIVLITCVDVIGRYFFNSPLYAGAEIIQVSMAGVIFFSLPYMFFQNEHIIVDLFPIFKKGAPNQCDNDRLISLLCVAYKVYASIVLKKIWA